MQARFAFEMTVLQTSGTGKFACMITLICLFPNIMLFPNPPVAAKMNASQISRVQKTSGTGKFACMITLIYIFISKKNMRRLQNLRYGKFAYKTGLYFPKYVLLLVFKTSGTGKFARKTGLHFPKYIFFFVFKNLLYRQICMQVYTPYTK